MQELGAIGTGGLFLAAGHLQEVLLGGDVQFLRTEARNGQRHAIAIIADPFDVEGGMIVVLRRAAVFNQVEQTIDADDAGDSGEYPTNLSGENLTDMVG